MITELFGKNVCVTGTLSLTRSMIRQIIESNGGIVGNHVKKTTSFVVVGSEPGSQGICARAHGIPTLTETEFFELIGKCE